MIAQPRGAAARPRFSARPVGAREAAVVAGLFLVLAVVLQVPGNVPYDGIVVWYEAETGRLFAQHPAALVLIWRLCEKVVRGPALFTTLQLSVLWLAVGLLLARYRPPLWTAIVFAGVLLLWPPLLAQAGLTVKDVFGAHLALLAFALAEEKLPTPWRWFAAFVSGTLAFLLRYQFGLILPLLVLLLWRERDGRLLRLACAGLGVIVTIGIIYGAVQAEFVRTGPGDVSMSLRKMAIFDIAGITARDPSVPLPEFAGAGVDVPRLKREMAAEYSPVRVDTLWQVKGSGSTITPSSGVFGRLYEVPDATIFAQWRHAGAARPAALLHHRLAAFGRLLGFGDIWQCRPVMPGISWLPREGAAAVKAQTYPAPLSARVMKSAVFPVSLTFRAAPYVALLVLVVIFGGTDAALLAGFALAYELSFLLLPQACEVRYSYPVVLAALVAGAMALQRRFV